MLATEHLEPQVSHCKKKSRVSFWRIVSGERHVWHVTYSLIYLLRTFSICFCWKRPLIINWLLPSTEPLVPNSASKKSSKCLGCLCNVLQICKIEIYRMKNFKQNDQKIWKNIKYIEKHFKKWFDNVQIITKSN